MHKQYLKAVHAGTPIPKAVCRTLDPSLESPNPQPTSGQLSPTNLGPSQDNNCKPEAEATLGSLQAKTAATTAAATVPAAETFASVNLDSPCH
jgi:hypothetical protein